MKVLTCKNNGNTCYFNAVLQCFLNDQLWNITIDPKHNELCCALKNICEAIDFEDNDELLFSSISVSKVLKCFQKSFPSFMDFSQHDAHECINSMLELFSNVNMYTGRFKISIKCLCCGSVSSHYEPFTSVMLSVTGKNNTLYDLFEQYLQHETIDGYQCDHCKSQTKADRKTWIYTLPQRLIVVLKRYSENEYHCKVDYPNKSMNVRNPVDSSIYKYSLGSVIHHQGGTKRGHYYTNVKINNNWYLFDDCDVYLNEKIRFNDPSAYVLVYCKS
jgi:ubiquitin C-terminal hydrolase